MAMETNSFAGGDIEGHVSPAERRRSVHGDARTRGADRRGGEAIARFHRRRAQNPRHRHLRFPAPRRAAATITAALRERAKNNVAVRIIYDATTEPDRQRCCPPIRPRISRPTERRPAPRLSSILSPISRRSRPVTGYRVLMHSKYLIRDGDSDDAAVFSARQTTPTTPGDCRRTISCKLRSRPLAAYFSKNFAGSFRRRTDCRTTRPVVTSMSFVLPACR